MQRLHHQRQAPGRVPQIWNVTSVVTRQYSLHDMVSGNTGPSATPNEHSLNWSSARASERDEPSARPLTTASWPTDELRMDRLCGVRTEKSMRSTL